MKKENVFVKVFALWLLSLWFVAVAYSDEAGSNAESEGSSKKEIICKEDYYWIKDILDEKGSWIGRFDIECFNKDGEAQCYVKDMGDYNYENNETMFKLFFDTWLTNKDRAFSINKWFEEGIDKLYKENCKEVEF